MMDGLMHKCATPMKLNSSTQLSTSKDLNQEAKI